MELMKNDLPTEAGHYWMIDLAHGEDKPSVVQVRLYGGKLCILNWEIPAYDSRVYWSGKIPQPEPPKGE